MFQAKNSGNGVVNPITQDITKMQAQQEKEHALLVSQSFSNRAQHELRDTGNSSLALRFFSLKDRYHNIIVPPNAVLHLIPIVDENLGNPSSYASIG